MLKKKIAAWIESIPYAGKHLLSVIRFVRFHIKQVYRTIEGDSESRRFSKIKYKTSGYLAPNVYHYMYQYAYDAPNGDIIDIGPAQGGTTISLALGLKESGKKATVYSIEKGINSNALANINDQFLNEKILRKNIGLFNVNQYANVIINSSDRAFDNTTPQPKKLSVLSIDADGALDRDFHLFYNLIVPNGRIILDDYADIINRHGKRYIDTDYEKLEEILQEKGVKTLAEITPLGKEYTTYRFVNYIMKEGLVKMDKVIGSTFFGEKPETAPQFHEKHLRDMKKIRAQIEKDFWSLRKQ